MSTDSTLSNAGLKRGALNGPAMGARWSAVFYADDDFDAAALAAGLQRAVDDVEREMSAWRPDSDVERLNRAPVGVWVDVPRNLMQVLQAALLVGELSGGAFDIGVGDLVKAWGLGAGARTPDAEGIARLSGRAGPRPPQILQLDTVASKARKLAPMRLDLSGIAKGFGVDELARVMEAQGLSNWLVGIDGEMRAAGGKPGGSSWTVGHERPHRDARSLMGVIDLDDSAVATSGDYRHGVEIDGRGYSHTFDPRRAAPLANDLASVTVLAPTAMAADAWATALMVLGAQAGAALARRVGLRAIFIAREGEAHGRYTLVFPDLSSPTSNSPLGDRPYDEFKRGLDKAVPDASARKKVLHAFRKTFGDSLKQAGVVAEIRGDILGHRGEAVTAHALWRHRPDAERR